MHSIAPQHLHDRLMPLASVMASRDVHKHIRYKVHYYIPQLSRDARLKSQLTAARVMNKNNTVTRKPRS